MSEDIISIVTKLSTLKGDFLYGLADAEFKNQ